MICDGPDDFRKAVRKQIKDGAEIIKLGLTGGHGLAFPADVMAMTLEEMNAAAGYRSRTRQENPRAYRFKARHHGRTRRSLRPNRPLRHDGRRMYRSPR